MTVSGIAAQVLTELDPLRRLLKGARVVGGIYHLDFDRAIVVTNDHWKRQIFGIPNYSFLLATTMWEGTVTDTDDEEIVLLRVEGIADLPNQSERVLTRFDAMQRAVRDGQPATEIVDPLTQGEMQWSGLDCRVLGTFYTRTVANRPYVAWGSDLDNIYSAARYFVYFPSPEALSFIASYPEDVPEELIAGEVPHKVRIGSVRYASTMRRSLRAGTVDVGVNVRVSDFISMKTAVFGMTRSGKSNTLKMILSAVYEHSQRNRVAIGQLVFDPAGEYANENPQDGTALANLGPEAVSIYRYGAKPSSSGVRPLQINFYASDQLETACQVIADRLADKDSAYIKRFLSVSLEDPNKELFSSENEHWKAKAHVSRGRLAFYALLAKAGFVVPQGWVSPPVSMKESLSRRILEDHPGALRVRSGNRSQGIELSTADGLRTVMNWLVENADDPEVAEWGKGEQFSAIKDVYDISKGSAALSLLKSLKDFHSPYATSDHREDIFNDLVAGKIVIVDLSFGSENVTQVLSERIVNYLLAKASERFRENLPPHKIQVCVEEAHRLFDRNNFAKLSHDPWVRLAKEAAKFEIGLVYATQEVSSVEPQVLANTHNWVVAHLNSDTEIKELSHYYDFSSFGSAILRSEDRGYVRLKTLSGKYIVPVQVDKFSDETIERARAVAGLGRKSQPVDLSLQGGHNAVR